MRYEISEELLKSLIDYLVLRPYREVTVLLNKLSTSKPIKDEGNKGKKPDES